MNPGRHPVKYLKNWIINVVWSPVWKWKHATLECVTQWYLAIRAPWFLLLFLILLLLPLPQDSIANDHLYSLKLILSRKQTSRFTFDSWLFPLSSGRRPKKLITLFAIYMIQGYRSFVVFCTLWVHLVGPLGDTGLFLSQTIWGHVCAFGLIQQVLLVFLHSIQWK